MQTTHAAGSFTSRPRPNSHARPFRYFPISFVALSHTETHTHTHARWSIPGIAFNIWLTGFCLLLHLRGCPLQDPCAFWWITCRTGWMAPRPPHLHLLCYFILSASLICHPHWPFVTWLGCAVCFTCRGVFAYAHTCDFPDPRLQRHVGCHHYMNPGDVLSPVTICLIFCHFSTVSCFMSEWLL